MYSTSYHHLPHPVSWGPLPCWPSMGVLATGLPWGCPHGGYTQSHKKPMGFGMFGWNNMENPWVFVCLGEKTWKTYDFLYVLVLAEKLCLFAGIYPTGIFETHIQSSGQTLSMLFDAGACQLAGGEKAWLVTHLFAAPLIRGGLDPCLQLLNKLYNEEDI